VDNDRMLIFFLVVMTVVAVIAAFYGWRWVLS
jgi:hypothetical protein